MADLKDLGTLIDAEVLVVGGGFAGAWAALRAKDFVDKVVLVDKAQVAKSGCSSFATGDHLCPTRDDDLDLWKKEIVEASDYFSDQNWVDLFLRNQIERVEDYMRWGAPIKMDDKGKIVRRAGRGQINTRIFHFYGMKLMPLLRQKLLEKKVQIIERIMVTDLLFYEREKSKRVTGAVGFNTRSGDFYIFRAGTTILATGPLGSKMNKNVDNCTGDGIAMAYRAGAELANMEFCTSRSMTVWEKAGHGGGTSRVQSHGGIFVNALGQRFMDKYDPIRGDRTVLSILCMSFAKEALDGRGPVYVDMRHSDQETFESFFRAMNPRTLKLWEYLGKDLRKEKLECAFGWNIHSSSGLGGILINSQGATNIPGLYAAGAVTRDPVQGISSLGGMPTASCNVMGYVCGEQAVQYFRNVGMPNIELSQVKELKQLTFLPLETKAGKEASILFRNLDEAVVPASISMFKNSPRIIKALAEIEKSKEELPRLSAQNNHELVKANEFKNHLLNAELVFRAALERKESRQYHYREDYPYIDNIDWLKLIVFKKQKERVSLRYEPIPLEKWTIRPEKLEKKAHPLSGLSI